MKRNWLKRYEYAVKNMEVDAPRLADNDFYASIKWARFEVSNFYDAIKPSEWVLMEIELTFMILFWFFGVYSAKAYLIDIRQQGGTNVGGAPSWTASWSKTILAPCSLLDGKKREIWFRTFRWKWKMSNYFSWVCFLYIFCEQNLCWRLI